MENNQGRPNYQGVVQPKNFPPLPVDWVSDWETFASSDGTLQLYSVLHRPQEWKGPRALVIFHGLGEHGGRYLHAPHYVQSVVDSVYCLDHRGHGRSEGLRGHVERFDLYADDAALAISRLDEQLKRRFGKSEIHLLGHSMGGLIGLRACLQHPHLPLSSVTISAPLLGVRVPIPKLKKWGGQIMARVWGSLHMGSGLDATWISRDKDVVSAYKADRLVHGKVTPRFFLELQNAMAETLKQDSGFEFPLQMLVPMEDHIVDSPLAMDYFRSLKLREKSLKTYPGFYHEPFNEIGKEQVFADLADWIKTHSKS